MKQENNIDPVKTLTILAQLWAHQNGLSIKDIKIEKKTKKEN